MGFYYCLKVINKQQAQITFIIPLIAIILRKNYVGHQFLSCQVCHARVVQINLISMAQPECKMGYDGKVKKFRDKEKMNGSTQDPGRKKLRARQGYLL